MGLVFYLQYWNSGRADPGLPGEAPPPGGRRTPPSDFSRLICRTGTQGGPIPACRVRHPRKFPKKLYTYQLGSVIYPNAAHVEMTTNYSRNI